MGASMSMGILDFQTWLDCNKEELERKHCKPRFWGVALDSRNSVLR
jgi:hypothetical protein